MIHKRASHHQDHKVAADTAERLLAHTPGLDIEVTWTVGRAAQTREAFDRAVAEVRAQIVDARETR